MCAGTSSGASGSRITGQPQQRRMALRAEDSKRSSEEEHSAATAGALSASSCANPHSSGGAPGTDACDAAEWTNRHAS